MRKIGEITLEGKIFLLLVAMMFYAHFNVLLLKVFYGRINTALIAAIPVILLCIALYLSLIHGLATSRLIARMHIMDLIVVFLFIVDVIHVFNVHLLSIEMGLRGFSSSTIWMAAYFLARKHATSRDRLSYLVHAVTYSILIAAILGILLRFTAVGNLEAAYRASLSEVKQIMIQARMVGTLASPFSYAMLLNIGIICLLAGTSNVPKRKTLYSLFYYCALVVLFGALVVTGSRGPLASVLAACAVMAAVSQLIRKRLAVCFIALFVLGIVIIWRLNAVYGILDNQYYEYYRNRVVSIASPTDDGDFMLRRDYFWKGLMPYFRKNPLGYGTGALPGTTDRYRPIVGQFQLADNQYLRIMIEQGAIGLFAYFLVLTGFGVVFMRRFKSSREIMYLIPMGIVVIFAVAGITNPPLEAYPVNFIFWGIMGSMMTAFSEDGYGR